MPETYGHDLHLARLLPEFTRLQAILGRKLRDTDSWAPYARLVALHGWKRLIRAAEQADPDKRWANDLERLCNRYADEAKQEAREAEQRAREASRPKVADRKGMGEMFRSVRERYGV